MADVRRVKLPGVGVLHTFKTSDGGKCGVITHRSGHSDLITFADYGDDSDGNKVSLRLTEDEAHTLAELLGNLAQRGIPGLTVVAVVRGETTSPAPAQDFKVFPGDTLVVAGSPEKVAKAFGFFRTGELVKPPQNDRADAPAGG